MLVQFILGSTFIVITVVIATVLMALSLELFHQAKDRLLEARPFTRTALALIVITLSMLAVLSVVMWMWAFAFLALGVFDTLEEAIYFSMVSFTTLGFGDVLATDDWRLLSGFVATGGFILFGLSTAFMFEAIAELRQAHRARRDRRHQPARPK